AMDDSAVLGETQAPRKGASDVDTLPPANDLKKGTVISGKERRTPKTERRTTDLPGIEPMSLEEPEGVH
ncbi:MAG: hypothetical protein IT342_22325, partial [Candidatus Melainabacteria bacterium]|nr:hypothetical protein [Candidatus Melainabacteria bacterium]